MSRASTSASRRSWAPEQSNSANALRLAALHGQGLIMSPMFLVAEEIKAGRLVAILEEFLRDEHAINAIYPHRQHVPAKVRSFIDLLIRSFASIQLGRSRAKRRRSIGRRSYPRSK